MTQPAILAIDQGTTSSRAFVFDVSGGIVSKARQEIGQHYPRPGWVEQEPEDIWLSVLSTARRALEDAFARGFNVVAIGITN